jgi:hypothetical protein
VTTLASVLIRATYSALPAPGIAGRTFFASDTGAIYYDNGVGWTEVSPGTASATISAVQQQAYCYTADSGVANAYAVVLAPAPVLIPGSLVVFKAAAANTGASTLAVNGAAAVAIVKQGSVPLAGGEIAAGQIIRVVYDGANFQM